MKVSWLALFNLAASIETQGRSGARNWKFRSSNVRVLPGEFFRAADVNPCWRRTEVTALAPTISPAILASAKAQMACARPWRNAPALLENSNNPRIASTKPVTSSPNISRPINPLTTTIPGDLPRTLIRIPTHPANARANKTNISESAHLRLVPGRREIAQHLNAPARN